MAWALVISIDVFWLLQAPWLDWKLWLGLSLTVLAGAVACRFRLAGGNGDLQWDGSAWSYRDGERATTGLVTVHLDLQSALLVFWAPACGAGTWLWVRSATLPSQWLALRRAVFATDRTPRGDVDGARTDLVARP